MKIVHLSDLHFGTEHPGIVAKLIDDINHYPPDLIIVSGDLTQRARKAQFQAARKFLQALKSPILCVPGNHDIPLYNLLYRLTIPFRGYQSWISQDLTTYFVNSELAVIGINSVTPYKPMGGYVKTSQLRLVKQFFAKHEDTKIKIVALHHNLIKSERHKIINQAEKIINDFAQAKVNLVLSGHIHFPYIELLKRNYLKHSMYVITAGTPISTRTIEPNSYNILEFKPDSFSLIVRGYNGKAYFQMSEENFSL